MNDFAKVIDADSASAMDRMIRTLQAATGDVVVVATVPTIEPYGDIKEYAVKLFANNGKGIGQKGKNNGLLILLALKERRVWVEVGYDLEQWITDGFAGETSRDVMTPFFRNGRYGEGLRAGAERIIGRIAQGRGVTLEGVRVPRQAARQRGSAIPGWLPIVIFIVILIVSRLGGGGGRRSGSGAAAAGRAASARSAAASAAVSAEVAAAGLAVDSADSGAAAAAAVAAAPVGRMLI